MLLIPNFCCKCIQKTFDRGRIAKVRQRVSFAPYKPNKTETIKLTTKLKICACTRIVRVHILSETAKECVDIFFIAIAAPRSNTGTTN